MAEKTLKTRIIQKHDTEANWLLATNFTPMNGEIIIYDEDDNYNYKRIKIGNGIDNVNDLDFVINKEDVPEGVTSWNDLTDKPFYSTVTTDVILAETTLTGFAAMEEPIYVVQNPFTLELTEGGLYTVIWDNVPYNCEFMYDQEFDTPYLGNRNYVNMTSGGDMPFCIIYGGGNIFVAVESTIAESSHTIEIVLLNENVVKLDQKYTHNADWSQNDENAPGYIENRPFYETESYVAETIYDDTIAAEDVVYNEYGKNYYVSSNKRPVPTTPLVGDTEYEVIFNGTTYNVLCRPEYYPVMGDMNLETYPFNMYYQNDAISIECKEAGPITLKISRVEPAKIVKLDTKFIPFVTNTTTKTLSWDGNTERLAAHYYDDRYYKISDQVLTEQDVANGGRIVDSYGDIIDFTADDIRIINEGSESSFMNLNNEVYLTRDGIYFYKDNRYNYTVSLEINDFDGFVVETIRSPYINAYTKEESDAKYQPKIAVNWEQSDESAADYVKNRTHYKEIGGLETVFEEATVTVNGIVTSVNDTWYYQNNTYLDGKFIIEENKVYIVTFDGNTYVLNPKRDVYSTYIGNSEYVTSEHNPDEEHIPFAIDYYNRTSGVMILKTHYIGEHTIKVEVGEYIYYQLDEKYIPDTIARKADIPEVDLTSYQTKSDENLTTTDKTIVGAINEIEDGLVGENTTGTVYTIDNESVAAAEGAEIFNDYTNNKAVGKYSHAEGSTTIATGEASHAEGQNTTASGAHSHAEGFYTRASDAASHAEGADTKSSGYASHAEGSYTEATGIGSHAEGVNSKATGDISHAEGNGAQASGAMSHAEGYNTIATANYTHAEGSQTIASAMGAHAEGNMTEASGYTSHAEGNLSIASGAMSHAEGYNTIAKSNFQHVEGQYNIEDSTNKYAHIVGNGSSKTPSNAHTLDWDGNAWYQGNVYVGGTSQDDASQLATTTFVEEKVAALVDSAPDTLNTLNELATAIQDHQDVTDALNAVISDKQNKTDEALNTTNKTVVGAINELNTSISDKANATHTHAISDITDLETTLSNTASAIAANTDSITAHSTAISNLQTAIEEIEEVTSAEIQALFSGTGLEIPPGEGDDLPDPVED